jgi:hypothetical protein
VWNIWVVLEERIVGSSFLFSKQLTPLPPKIKWREFE